MSFFVVIRGPLGVGKTTVSKRLTKEIGGEYISIDRILDEHGLWESGRLAEFLGANEFAVRRAKRFLGRGTPVIFDGNFYWKSQIEDLIGHLEYPHHVFTLKAPLRVCIDRDSDRMPSHGAQGAREVYRKVTRFENGTSVDASQPVSAIVGAMRTHLPQG